MQNNQRWKSLQDAEEIRRFLRANQQMRIYDTGSRENRYVMRDSAKPDQPTGFTVDGRSMRAILFELVIEKGGFYRLKTETER
jgi:hypothetical protein